MYTFSAVEWSTDGKVVTGPEAAVAGHLGRTGGSPWNNAGDRGNAQSWRSLAWGGLPTKCCSGGARRTCTVQEEVRSFIDQATQRFGRVDIVVNNAGIIQVGPMATTTLEDFANTLNVMF
jgi:NAD(P)-dependent dehydrogenase (short-subunit alcohol dehydrogenase family)